MLRCLGPTAQCIFNTLPGEHKSLEEVKAALRGYFAPKRNVVAERYKFRSRAHKADESIDTYLTNLRELAKSCDFGTLEEEMIREQIVDKCSSRTLTRKLLQQDDLDLAKTIKIAKKKGRTGRTRGVIAVTRHQGKPDPDRPRARFPRIPSETVHLLQMWWNRRTHS